MRTVHVVSFRMTPAALASCTAVDSKQLETMAATCVQRYYTKRAADKLEAELRASGLWIVERTTMLAGTLEDVFMHITGLCPTTP